jgi:uncharacterized protein (DUF305 family)
MKNLKLGACVGAIILMLSANAFAGGMCDENGHCNCHDMQAMNHGSENPPKSAFDDVMMKMHKSMGDAKPTGNVDIDFVQGMIPHHQGAIDMAKIELAKGKDPQNLKMAKEIIEAQEKEIAAMREWLAKHKAQ